MPKVFERQSPMPVSAEELLAWHARPGAFERLVPPWSDVRVVARTGEGIEPGSEVTLRMKQGGLPLRWVARHGAIDGLGFSDEQVRGPFRRFHHEHRMVPRGEESALVDRITWAPPLAGFFAAGFIQADLDRTFAFRHARTRRDLMRHRSASGAPLRVAISGASGLVGTALCAFLSTGGHDVVRLVRRAAGAAGEVRWDPDAGTIDEAALGNVDAIVHLAGENVGEGRWTDERKRRILESRTRTTELLARTAASAGARVFVSASAIGYYGDQGDRWVDEASPLGEGFLASVCQAWEAAAEPARAAGVRTVHTRIGVVMSPKGGALQKLLPIFRLGAGGPVGSGKQYMSWVSLDDVVYAIHHALGDEALAGPVNVVAPEPVTNRDFARILGAVLRRPAWFPVPETAIRLAFGDMGRETVLASNRVRPTRLVERGYDFAFPDLEGALRHELGR